MIEELKAAIADVRASGEKWDGLAPWSYPGGKAAAFLAKHGPALIAAVELADIVDHIEQVEEDCEHDGVVWNTVCDNYANAKLALDAYRAAKKENNHES